MYCKECGSRLIEGASFCAECGARIDWQPQKMSTSDESLNHPDKSNQASGRPDAFSEDPKSKKNSKKKVGGQKTPPEKGNGTKKRVAAGIILLVFAVVCVAFSLVYLRNSSPQPVGEVKEYSNGDTVYIPTEDDLAYDKDELVIYYDNLILVYLKEDLGEADAKKLAKTVNGTVAGDISGAVNVLQIVIESTDLDEINAKAQTLMESDDVLYAGYDFPLFIEEEADSNPWNDSGVESDLGNEDDPDGNDWWAEAVGAYTAWELTASTRLDDVSVGIIDSGFDLDHEDLSGSISMMSGYEDQSASDHGTHVAGIIGANNNSVGIRGIADSADLICVDWNPVTNDPDDEYYTSLLSTGEYIEIIKSMVENNVKVINNSWGNNIDSEKEFWGNTIWTKFVRAIFGEIDIVSDYETYLSYAQVSADSTGRTCMLLIYQLMMSGYEDFLIVQSAGNSSVNAALYNGCFCSANEDSFKRIFTTPAYTYEDIDEHILIVGAVDNIQSSSGSYEAASYSNYGTAVDIFAPGGYSSKIYSTLTTIDDSGDSSNDGLIYGNYYGTSMAAPMVAGAAALLWQINEDFTVSDIRELLLDSTQTAVGTGDDSGEIYPMLDIGESVRKALYAWYGGTVADTNGNALEGLTVTALDENGNILYSDITSEDGTYVVYCSNAEIKYVTVLINDEEAGRVEVPEKYQNYNAAAARDPSEAGFAANELDTIEVPLVEVQFYIQNESGEFLDDAIIRLYDSDGGVGITTYSHDGGEYPIEAVVDENGNSVYTALVFPGSYDFSVWVNGYKRKSECISVSESQHSFTYILGEETVAGSGICGDNLTWTLYDDYTLVISGTGDMYDYAKVAKGDEEVAPWRNVRFKIGHVYNVNMVKYIFIEEGVTSIGNYAFYSESFTYIEMPDSITSVGEGAFDSCSDLKTVKLSDNIISIGRLAFGNTHISEIIIPKGVTSIEYQAFYNCDFLTAVYMPASVTELGKEVFIYCSALDYIYYEGTQLQWDALTADISLGYQAEPEVCYESY